MGMETQTKIDLKKDIKYSFITLWNLNDWGMYNRRNEAILWELSRRDIVESVLHIEHISLKGLIYKIKQWLGSKDKTFRLIYWNHIKKGFSLKPVLIKNEKKYYIYSVVNCYSGNISIFKKLSDFIRALQYRAINKHFVHSKKKVVLIVYPPSSYLSYAINAIKHDLLIADFVDDVLERTDDLARKKEVKNNYKSILPKCKWIFSTSPDMDHKYRELAKQKIDFLPNGVDINLYNVETEPDLISNKSKVVGYVGSLNRTIDEDLLEYVMSAHPRVKFAIIGHAEGKKSKDIVNRLSENCHNFHFLGKRHFRELPKYIKKCDVLINFKKNDYTTAGGDSQKIYEYLATGKPVVTTPVPPADRFADLMYVASNKYQFAEYLKKALEEDNNIELMKKRIKAASENSWSKRVDVILDKVSAIL